MVIQYSEATALQRRVASTLTARVLLYPVNDNSFLLIVRDAGAISSESLQLQMNRVVQREINIQYMCFILFNYWLLVLYLFIDE